MPSYAYSDCKWCHGSGCNQCTLEKEKDFEESCKPLFTAHYDNPEEMKILKDCFGADSLKKELSLGGGGVQEIKRKLAIANLSLALKKNRDELNI